MTQTNKTAATAKAPVAIAVIVYGMNASSRPAAALFPASLCDHAVKAAGQLKLKALKVTTSEIADVARRLPIGRINSSGKGFVPTVRQGLYDEVIKAADGQPPATSKPAANGKATPGQAAAAKTNGSPQIDYSKLPLNEARKAGNPVATAEGLPKSWKDIGPSHLVLVQESLNDGWWEALVVARQDDMLSVRWRNYPNWKPFTVHVDAVALLNASPSFKA